MIYFTYRNGIKKNKKILKEEISEIVSPSPKPRDEDQFLSQIIEEQERAKKEADSAIRQLETDYEQRFGEDKALKERLAKFAKDQGLDKALTELWSQAKYFHSWSQREDWDQYNRYHWTDISGTYDRNEDNGITTDILNFTDHGILYSLTRIEHPPFMEMGKTVEMSLTEGDEVVFALKASYEFSDYGDFYSVFDITAFKKQGNWATMLMRCGQADEVESKKIALSMKHHDADTIRDRFKE